ncbi:MAG TPA: hypothetical protein VFQ25_12460 [Ktedonobacterales bacterium]|nr:hypothetical protein [Ktedonobacterales bacterium]
MAVTAAAPTREHERPMSWARAVVIAVGLFFLAAILLGQVSGYFFTISTLSKLTRLEQGALILGLLSIGLGFIAFEIAFLYDPRPLIPWPLFALLGLGITAVGAYFDYQVFTGAWHEYLPDAIITTQTVNGKPVATTTYWPTPGQSYLFHPAWFQPQSIDLQAIGLLGMVIGLGVLVVAAMAPAILSGRIFGPARDYIVRIAVAASVALLAVWVTVYTFAPVAFSPTGMTGVIGNIILFVALLAALLALVVWLLPIMVRNRQQFMPGNYLHGVVGLIGSIGVPLLLIWALAYPVVNLIHQVDANQIWVQCSQKNDIPGSCTFTPFTGYIICAIVFSIPFGLMLLGLYFWTTKRNMVVLGGTYGIVWAGLGATLIHQDDPAQLPFGLMVAAGIALLAFAWTWATQVEFAPTRPEPLGCTGQWLVLGTLLLFYLMGFALLSLPSFFEIEALALFYQPGMGGLHDAFWALLLMGGLGAFQLTVLLRRKPMGNIRKFALWALLFAVVLQLVGSIIGFQWDVLYYGVNAFGAGQAWFLAGIIFEVVGIAATLYGAMQVGDIRWVIAIVVVTLIGAAFGVITYNMPFVYEELVVMGFMLAMVGAWAYVAAGPDPEDLYELA